jgi:hypothetical protein
VLRFLKPCLADLAGAGGAAKSNSVTRDQLLNDTCSSGTQTHNNKRHDCSALAGFPSWISRLTRHADLEVGWSRGGFPLLGRFSEPRLYGKDHGNPVAGQHRE